MDISHIDSFVRLSTCSLYNTTLHIVVQIMNCKPYQDIAVLSIIVYHVVTVSVQNQYIKEYKVGHRARKCDQNVESKLCVDRGGGREIDD